MFEDIGGSGGGPGELRGFAGEGDVEAEGPRAFGGASGLDDFEVRDA